MQELSIITRSKHITILWVCQGKKQNKNWIKVETKNYFENLKRDCKIVFIVATPNI